MKVFYTEKSDINQTKFYALTIAKNGLIVSTTKDQARARDFNRNVYDEVIFYYQRVSKFRGQEINLGSE